MISSQLVLLLAASVSAQSTANLWQVEDFWPIEANSTATIIGSNPSATTYAFNCPTGANTLAPSAASSIKSAASSAAGAASSDLAALASSLGPDGASLISSAAAAGSSVGAAIGNDIASSIKSAANVELTPIAKPTNARRDNVRLLPIARPTQVRRDNVRLLPIPKPTLAARDGLPPMDVSIPCVPKTVIQGSETYAFKVATAVPVSLNGEFNATWKGEAKTAPVTATLKFEGGVELLNKPLTTATVASSEIFQTVAVAIVTGSASGSGSATSSSASSSPSGSAGASGSAPAANSNPGAAGPLPTGAAVYVGAAAGIFGAMLAL